MPTSTYGTKEVCTDKKLTNATTTQLAVYASSSSVLSSIESASISGELAVSH
jgi:hypothetical protein